MTLHEDSLSPSQPCLSDVSYTRLTIVEGKGDGKKLRLRGEFGWVDKPTANGRRYPAKLVEREIKRLQDAMAERRLYGELDHPQDGRTELKRASHVITALEVLPSGQVIGEAEVLPTPNGQVLIELVKAGCRVGVSSRGYGSTKVTEDGSDEVQDDFRLETYDVVADPAASTAYPKAYFEARERAARENMTEANKASESKATEPRATEAVLTLEAVAGLVAPFIESANGPVATLRKKLAESEARCAALEAERTEAVRLARVAAYSLHLERTLSNPADRTEVRTALGDLAQYENVEAFKTRVQQVQASFASRRAVRESDERALRVAKAERDAEVARLTQELAQARQQTAEAAALAKTVALRSYIENRVPMAMRAKVSALIESRRPRTAEDADKLIAELRVEADQPTGQNARARVKAALGSGRESSPLAEEAPAGGRTNSDYNGLGADIAELQRLAGLQEV